MYVCMDAIVDVFPVTNYQQTLTPTCNVEETHKKLQEHRQKQQNQLLVVTRNTTRLLLLPFWYLNLKLHCCQHA